MHKIIILEGADRVGKTGSVDRLVDNYRDSGYLVVTMFSANPGSYNQEISYNESEKYDSLMKENEKLFDAMSSGLLILSHCIKKTFDMHQGKDVVYIIDRLHLSSLVFGSLLRKDVFESLYGSEEFFIRFMNVFENRIQKFAEVELFVLYNSEKIIHDDTSNPLRITTKEELISTNEKFKEVFEHSTIRRKHLIHCKMDHTGWFDTYTQISRRLDIYSPFERSLTK